MSLMNDLLKKIETIAQENKADKVMGVKVRLGALSHISAGHFREHFVEGTKGTLAEDAELEIEVSEDINDPHAQDILLINVNIPDLIP